MSSYTADHLARLAISVEDYLRFPQDLSQHDLESAQLVVAVKETEHRPLMSQRFPQFVEKVEFWEVHDIDCAQPDEALPHLEREVTKLLNRLLMHHQPAAAIQGRHEGQSSADNCTT